MSDFTKPASQTQSADKAKVYLPSSEWDPKANKFRPYEERSKINGSVKIISTQNSKWVTIETPPMITWWGIHDFPVNGEPNKDFKIKLSIPGGDYATPETDEFLEKMQTFEDELINAAVENSEKWFGKKLIRELCEDRFFPSLKKTVSKEYGTKIEFQIKVPYYKDQDKWDVQKMTDHNGEVQFPVEGSHLTPPDLVKQRDKVKVIARCKGLWFNHGNSKWGVSWQFRESTTVESYSNRDQQQQTIVESENTVEDDTVVADSDEEVEEPVQKEPESVQEPEPEPEVVEPEPKVEAPKKKKVIKKVAKA